MGEIVANLNTPYLFRGKSLVLNFFIYMRWWIYISRNLTSGKNIIDIYQMYKYINPARVGSP